MLSHPLCKDELGGCREIVPVPLWPHLPLQYRRSRSELRVFVLLQPAPGFCIGQQEMSSNVHVVSRRSKDDRPIVGASQGQVTGSAISHRPRVTLLCRLVIDCVKISFGFRNLEFVRDISSLTREIAASSFKKPGPQILCHYTPEESSKKIVATRTLWATCLTEQSDKTELRHGIALVEEIAMKLLDKERNPFVQSVLSGLADYMRSRRSMLFITCFCGGDASPFHIEEYGSVCFRFRRPSGGPPPLTLNGLGVERWFSPVICGQNEQRRAIRKFLVAASALLLKHSVGSEAWSRENWMASTPQRDLGQCLLTIVASFKRSKFRRDREWRLIFAPVLSMSNTAPNLIDERFSALIESEPKRHICLRRETSFPYQDGSLWPPPHETLEPYDDVVHLTAPTRWSKIIAIATGQ